MMMLYKSPMLSTILILLVGGLAILRTLRENLRSDEINIEVAKSTVRLEDEGNALSSGPYYATLNGKVIPSRFPFIMTTIALVSHFKIIATRASSLFS
eukprot:scaffold1853_cov287-Chaetoceros_neogracile.AAC.5